jgi:photosystem II stability/assembly factor-like uncharacterized protein
MNPVKKRSLAVGVALTFGLLLLGLYFVWSYTAAPALRIVREVPLTPHDQLLGTWFDQAGHGLIVGSHGLILRTIDGGDHWVAVPSPVIESLTSVSFSDQLHGAIVGGNGVILTTSDQGLHWERRDSTTSQRLLKVQALDAQHEYAVGAFGTFVSSKDGGITWHAHKLPWKDLVSRLVDEFGYIEPNLNAVWFTTSQRGWIVGEFGLVLQTNDGGATWRPHKYGSSLPQFYDIAFQDDSNGWIVGQHGILTETGDGGQTWATVSLATTNDLQAIALQNGWGIAVGDQIAILLRNHLGEAPLAIPTLPNSVLSGVAWASNTPIAVGAAGSIIPIKLSELANTNERPSSLAVR